MKKLSYLFLIVLFCVSCRININKNNKPTKFTVSYETEYGVCPETFTVNENTILSSDQLQELNEYGYVFRGWFLDEVKIEPDVYIVKDNITLKAKWDYGYVISVEEFHNIAPELKEFNKINNGKETVYIYITDEDPDMKKLGDAILLASGEVAESYIYLDLSKCIMLEIVNEGVFTGYGTRKDIYKDYYDENWHYYDWEYYYYKGEIFTCDRSCVQTIIFPESLKKLGDRAFYASVNIKEIYLPSSIIEYGEGVFEACLCKAKIVLPENMEEIPRGTFAAYGLCYGLAELVWPKNVKTIGPYAFCNCYTYPDIEEIHIPDGVTTIKEYAYALSYFPKIIYLPASLEHIGYSAFANSKNLKKVIFPSSTDSLQIESGAFADCENLECFDFSELLKDGEEWTYEVNIPLPGLDKSEKISGVITNELLRPFEYNFLDFVCSEVKKNDYVFIDELLKKEMVEGGISLTKL